MNLVVFLGPTLDRREAEALVDATVLPPVSMGDVYAVARDRPWGIAIIDGAFDRVPSVWHKEILWAMSRGVHVYGSSSMGALRAAELHTFGMIGVGSVFEAYRDGTLTDDDEVAVVHGPAGVGYAAGSEAMVNIRATLEAARDAGLIPPAIHDHLVRLAKATHYADRSWARLWEAAAQTSSMPPGSLDALRAWLPSGRRDVKADDARRLLAHIRETRGTTPGPKEVGYRFHGTTFWEELRSAVARRPLVAAPDPAALPDDAVLEEVRITGDPYRHLRERALVRMLALEVAERDGEAAPPVAPLSDDAPRTPGFSSSERARLRAHDALCDRIRRRYAHNLGMSLRDEMRSAGQFESFDARARRKQEVLARRGLENPGCAEAGVAEPELWSWFFREVLARDVPPDLDAWAADHDFEDRDVMRRAVLREWVFRRSSGSRSWNGSDPREGARPHATPGFDA